MKFNIRKIEKEKLQKFMTNATMCALMTANIMGIQAKPFLGDTNHLNTLDTIKMDAFGKFGPETTLANTTATASPISVYVNNTPISFDDASPFIENGRTMVPLRGVFETMGYEVYWDNDVWSESDAVLSNLYGSTNPALISIRTGTNVLMGEISVLKDNTIMQNGAVVESDAAPKMVSGRYYLPLRAIAEATGAEVSWNNDSRRVDINFSSVSKENDQAVVESNQGADYVGKFGDADPVNNPMSPSVGIVESVNMQNYNHKIYYENAPAGNAHGLPEGAYYIDTDNALVGATHHSVQLGGVKLMNGQTLYIGESRASIESKFGSHDTTYDDGANLLYVYNTNGGFRVAYTASGRVKVIMVQSGSYNNYANKGFSYGTGGITLGASLDTKTYVFGPGESNNHGDIHYAGLMFGPNVKIEYEGSSGSDGIFSTVRIVARSYDKDGADPF